jgi:Domain of unknown function (DUF4410)
MPAGLVAERRRRIVGRRRPPGRRGASGPIPPTGTDLLILGQLVSIDQGNEAERVVIGLGAGRSDVEARVQVYETVSGRRIPVETMQNAGR